VSAAYPAATSVGTGMKLTFWSSLNCAPMNWTPSATLAYFGFE